MEILIILMLIVLNGVFAMAEIAIVSARKPRLEAMAEDGNHRAQAALHLTRSPNRFLSTVQIGITLIGILAGAFGGATVANDLARVIGNKPLAVALVVTVTTYLSLIIGELVPKRIGLQYSERVAMAVAGPMNWLSQAAGPLVSFLSLSTDTVVRLLGIQHAGDPPPTEAEIITLIEQGITHGVFAPDEQDMIEGVMQLDERRIASLMTPRPHVVWLSSDATLDEIRETVSQRAYPYYPVCHEDLDHVKGIVRAKDLLTLALSGKPIDLNTILRPPVYVPETVSASAVLGQFKATGTHMALIVGEYGGIEGIVTITDIMEEIVGEMDIDAPDMVQREDGSWLVDGILPIHRLEDVFEDIDFEDGKYQTVAGFVLDQLGRVPKVGDRLTWQGLYVEVVDMDGNRIDKLLVKRLNP